MLDPSELFDELELPEGLDVPDSSESSEDVMPEPVESSVVVEEVRESSLVAEFSLVPAICVCAAHAVSPPGQGNARDGNGGEMRTRRRQE